MNLMPAGTITNRVVGLPGDRGTTAQATVTRTALIQQPIALRRSDSQAYAHMAKQRQKGGSVPAGHRAPVNTAGCQLVSVALLLGQTGVWAFAAIVKSRW